MTDDSTAGMVGAHIGIHGTTRHGTLPTVSGMTHGTQDITDGIPDIITRSTIIGELAGDGPTTITTTTIILMT